MADYIKFKTPGYFKVVKIPYSVKKELPEEIREKLEGSNNESNYETEQVKEVEAP